jgi:hypothetical protein
MTVYRIVIEVDKLVLSKVILDQLMKEYVDNSSLKKLTWEMVGLQEDPVR